MSDKETTVADLKRIAYEFAEERDWRRFHEAKDFAIGMATEASELLAEFRFKSEEEAEGILQSPAGRERVGDELADVLYFILQFATRYGLDISTKFVRKMKKNAERYPIEKSKGSNKKYTELRE